jgi:hypothetical protein
MPESIYNVGPPKTPGFLAAKVLRNGFHQNAKILDRSGFNQSGENERLR